MTAKENVLECYPDAKVLHSDNKENEQYYIVTWREQSIGQFMRAYASTEGKAWEKAWTLLQKELLEKLMN